MLRGSARRPMGLSGRVSAALKAFRFAGGRNTFGSGYGGGWGGWLGGLFGLTPGSRYDFAKETFPLYRNGVVLAAVNRFALLWNEAPLVVFRPRVGDEPEMLKEHPALDLIANPTRSVRPGGRDRSDYDDTVLWGSTMLSLLTAGNGYWVKILAGAGNVARLQYVPDHCMEPYWDSDTEYITGFKYRIDGKLIPIPRDQVVHLRWMVSDPGNYRKGLAPLGGELRAVAVDNEGGNYTASILREMGVPGCILSADDDVDLTPEEAETIKKQFMERFTGDGRGRPMVSSIKVKVDKVAFSPEELALGSILEYPIPRICAALQIDPMVLGFASPNKTYANMNAALEAAYELTIIPLHSAIGSQMSEQIMPWVVGAKPGDYFGRDYAKVRALQEDMDAQYKRLSEAVKAGWLSANDAREQVGLKPIAGGEDLRPAGGIGIGQEDQEGQPGVSRAASLSPRQAAIAAKWQERRALALNGHS